MINIILCVIIATLLTIIAFNQKSNKLRIIVFDTLSLIVLLYYGIYQDNIWFTVLGGIATVCNAFTTYIEFNKLTWFGHN